MLSDVDALLAGVLANPADDLARLVFADGLEETGHPAAVARAAYVRLQVEAAACPDESAAGLRLTRLAAGLRGRFRDEADAVLATPAGAQVLAVRRRGFVDELRGTALSLRGLAAAVFAVAPVTALHVEDFRTHTDWMHSAIYLRQVTRLKVGTDAWAGGHHFARRDTPAGGTATIPTQAETLLHCRHLRGVESLDLSLNAIDDAWLLWFVARLPDTVIGRSLRHLDLSRNALGDTAAHLLAAARGLDGLARLDVTGNRITPGGQGVLRRRFGARLVV